MLGLITAIPNVDVLLNLEPEELAGQLVILMVNGDQNQFNPINVTSEPWNNPFRPGDGYPQQKRVQVEMALTEAFSWLVNNGLLIPDYSSSQWFVLSRRALRMEKLQDFRDFKIGQSLPADHLHRRIRVAAWQHFIRGAYAAAVFEAMREVEIAVRDGAGFAKGEHGVPMVRRAFHKDTGPLTDTNAEDAEKEALAALFVGAIGSYKNPHSHRHVPLDDPAEAAELVMLASHLLRIVDARTPKP